MYKQSTRHIITKRTISRLRNRYGYLTSADCQRLLGCTWSQLDAYLTAQIKPGLTIRDYDIDHIIPLTTIIDKEIVCHYTNLQLLTKEEHKQKSKHDKDPFYWLEGFRYKELPWELRLKMLNHHSATNQP